MTSGRTTPAIFGCEDEEGHWAGEYVVKLRGGLETRESGLLKEFIGSKLAAYFGVAAPEFAVVGLAEEMAELVVQVEPTQALRMRESVGTNFGTKLVTGFGVWPVDKSVPEAMWQSAVNVFAFGALIQNPDRRYGNPNLFAKGDALLVYDHELAFSFLYDLLPSRKPWKLGDQRYLTDHVFFLKLRSKQIELDDFTDRLASLSDGQIRGLFADVPAEWNNGNLSKIEAHLQLMREHASEFAGEIRGGLGVKVAYSYSVLRYVHDAVTQEFINIGVAVYSPAAQYFDALCTTGYGRISHMFETIDGQRFRQLARHIQDEIGRMGGEYRSALPFESSEAMEHLLARVLPPDDSALQFAKPGVGLSADLDQTLKDLFQRHVERYVVGSEPARRSDEDVWRVFREPLDRARVTAALRPKRIVASSYDYEFERSWKNEIWHVYEPVSFDMVEAGSMLEKANRWVGRATSLLDSADEFRIYLLLGEPQDERLQKTFVKAQNILHKMPGKKEFVRESEAEAFAEELAREMKGHPTEA